MKSITEKGLLKIRAAVELAYRNLQERVALPVIPMLALLDDLRAAEEVARWALGQYHSFVQSELEGTGEYAERIREIEAQQARLGKADQR